ncbi:MAG: tripartite tricarboxylate transporter substrate binding protein BugE [Betaproteobacteria bacterium]|nr:MAG: tripartite tricarboxylate transporter substrate binding protein BugE [Betaproteobacteria bacterium]
MRFIKTVTALAVSLAASMSFAQAYPNKPIKLVVPFAPGGSTDIVARIMASKLSPILGQPVIVENRAGAGGSIGAAEIAKAAPDGYTIGMGSVSTMGTNIVAYKNNKLDPMTQFTHITNIASVPGVIFVNKNFPFKDYKSFVDELKKNPGKHSYASSGAGGVGHLAMELFLVEIGGDAQHIAYKGAGPAVTDVLAGNVPIMWDNLSSSLQNIKAGNFIPLGVAYPKRSPALPNVPTFAELGLPNYEADTWFGFVGPAGMPADIVKKIYEATLQTLKDPDTLKKLDDNGALPIGNSPAEFKAQIQREVTKWKRVVDQKKISLEL